MTISSTVLSKKLKSSSSDEYIVVSDLKIVVKASVSLDKTTSENNSIVTTAIYNTKDVTVYGNCSTTTYEGKATHDALGEEKKNSKALDSSVKPEEASGGEPVNDCTTPSQLLVPQPRYSYNKSPTIPKGKMTGLYESTAPLLTTPSPLATKSKTFAHRTRQEKAA